MTAPSYRRVRIVCKELTDRPREYIATAVGHAMLCAFCREPVPVAGDELHSVTTVRKGDSR